MEAKKFRIGNLILIHDCLQEIVELPLPENCTDENTKGIPLTEEWLLKTQCKVNENVLAKYFNYGLNDYTKVTLMICNDKGKGEFYVMIHQEYEFVSITRRMFFVHDWQNLFFALTGTELEFKQSVSACS